MVLEWLEVGGYERDDHLFLHSQSKLRLSHFLVGLIPPLVVLKLTSPRMDKLERVHCLLSPLV